MSISKRVIGPLGIALLCWSQQAIALECPRMEKTGPGVLQETKRDEMRAVMSRTKSVSPSTICRKDTRKRVILNWSTISSARIARLWHQCPT